MTSKYTISRLNEETGIDRRTIAKILSTTKPVETNAQSDFYSLADFIKALREYDTPDEGGSYRAERLRKTKEEADAIAIKNAVARGELIDKECYMRGSETILLGVKQIIEDAPGLTEDESDKILTEMAKLFEPR